MRGMIIIMIRTIVRNIKSRILAKKREKWLEQLRGGLKSSEFTIISNNCTAGFIYHDLGIEFQSPTINLFFPPEDYLEFAQNFQYYKNCNLIELEDTDRSYPVGVIKAKDDCHKDIVVYFQHYKTFEEAKRKWIDRYNRVKWDKLFFIFEFYDTLYDNDLIHKFDILDSQNKVLLVHREELSFKNSFYISCYEDDKPIAKIFEINSKTGRRNLDEFDYVTFLNGDGIHGMNIR